MCLKYEAHVTIVGVRMTFIMCEYNKRRRWDELNDSIIRAWSNTCVFILYAMPIVGSKSYHLIFHICTYCPLSKFLDFQLQPSSNSQRRELWRYEWYRQQGKQPCDKKRNQLWGLPNQLRGFPNHTRHLVNQLWWFPDVLFFAEIVAKIRVTSGAYRYNSEPTYPHRTSYLEHAIRGAR